MCSRRMFEHCIADIGLSDGASRSFESRPRDHAEVM